MQTITVTKDDIGEDGNLSLDYLVKQRLPNQRVGLLKRLFGDEKIEITFDDEAKLKLKSLSQTNHEDIAELKLTGCKNLTRIESLSPKLKLLDANDCEALETLPKFPKTLETLRLVRCKKLAVLPKLPHQRLINLNIHGCESLTEIPKLPSTLHRFNISNCKSVTKIHNIPPYSGSIDLNGYESLLELPNFPQMLTRINLVGCKKLKTIPQLPRHLESLDLTGCDALEDSDHKLRNTEEYLRNLGCIIYLPTHLQSASISSIMGKFETIVMEYKKQHEEGAPFTRMLINRYIRDCAEPRGGTAEVTKEVSILLNILEKNPEHLEWVEKISSLYAMEGCINQPVAGFNLIMAWLDVSNTPELKDKVNAAKRVEALDSINVFISTELSDERGKREDSNFMKEVEVEAGNLLLIEVHARLLKDGIITKAWDAVPSSIAYAPTVTNFVTKERISKAYEAAKAILQNDNPKEVIDFLLQSPITGDDSIKNPEIFGIIAFGKDPEFQKIEMEFKQALNSLPVETDDFTAQVKKLESQRINNIKQFAEKKIGDLADLKIIKPIGSERLLDEKERVAVV